MLENTAGLMPNCRDLPKDTSILLGAAHLDRASSLVATLTLRDQECCTGCKQQDEHTQGGTNVDTSGCQDVDRVADATLDLVLDGVRDGCLRCAVSEQVSSCSVERCLVGADRLVECTNECRVHRSELDGLACQAGCGLVDRNRRGCILGAQGGVSRDHRVRHLDGRALVRENEVVLGSCSPGVGADRQVSLLVPGGVGDGERRNAAAGAGCDRFDRSRGGCCTGAQGGVSLLDVVEHLESRLATREQVSLVGDRGQGVVTVGEDGFRCPGCVRQCELDGAVHQAGCLLVDARGCDCILRAECRVGCLDRVLHRDGVVTGREQVLGVCLEGCRVRADRLVKRAYERGELRSCYDDTGGVARCCRLDGDRRDGVLRAQAGVSLLDRVRHTEVLRSVREVESSVSRCVPGVRTDRQVSRFIPGGVGQRERDVRVRVTGHGLVDRNRRGRILGAQCGVCCLDGVGHRSGSQTTCEQVVLDCRCRPGVGADRQVSLLVPGGVGEVELDRGVCQAGFLLIDFHRCRGVLRTQAGVRCLDGVGHREGVLAAGEDVSEISLVGDGVGADRLVERLAISQLGVDQRCNNRAR